MTARRCYHKCIKPNRKELRMEKIDKVKLGVVGLGRGGMVAEICAGLPNFELTAMCDIDPAQIEDAKRMLRRSNVNYDNIFFTQDYDELLKSDCNAVYVATYATLHVPFVIKALEAGKHVISEIPAINSLEEAKELRRAVKKHPHLKYMTGENCNFWAFIQAWKELYDQGRLGEVVFAEGEYLHAVDFREIQLFLLIKWSSVKSSIKGVYSLLNNALMLNFGKVER